MQILIGVQRRGAPSLHRPLTIREHPQQQAPRKVCYTSLPSSCSPERRDCGDASVATAGTAQCGPYGRGPSPTLGIQLEAGPRLQTAVPCDDRRARRNAPVSLGDAVMRGVAVRSTVRRPPQINAKSPTSRGSNDITLVRPEGRFGATAIVRHEERQQPPALGANTPEGLCARSARTSWNSRVLTQALPSADRRRSGIVAARGCRPPSGASIYSTGKDRY